jgi:hypothetical protein
MIRKILFALWLFPAMHGAAQQPAPAAGSNWQRVMALPLGTQVVVKAKAHNMTCNLKAVDAETLTCGPRGVLGNSDVVFQQAEIKLIKIKRRGRSTLIGAGIGGVAGAITGFAATTNNGGGWFGPNFLRGPATAGMAIGVGGIGAIVGVTTDFASSTVYKAP